MVQFSIRRLSVKRLVSDLHTVTMKWPLFASILWLYFALVSSNTDGYSISCSSEFSPEQGTFCVGIPLQCTVQLNSVNCGFGGPVLLLSSDISLQLSGSSLEPTSPDFTMSQAGFSLTITVDHYPSSTPSSLRVQLLSFHAECSFNVDSNNIPILSQTQCLHPLIFDVNITYPTYPGEVKGGDIISLDLELTANLHTLQDLVVAIGNFHPGLILLSNTSFTVSDPSAEILSYTTDFHSISSSNSQPVLFISQLSSTESLIISLSFQVQPFLLPQAALLFSFSAFYYISTYGTFTFKTSTLQFREFVVSSPRAGNYSLNLPHYASADHVEDTFPPHENDIFEMYIPFYFPCVSTNLNIEVSIPEFWSEFYTFFFTNVTSANLATPTNFFSLPSLCDYRVFSTFDSDACYMSSLANSITPSPVITMAEKAAAGVDTISIDFGVVWRNVTVGESCVGDSPDPGCSCNTEEMAKLTLTGVILTEIPCENQTLADNVTTFFSFERDVNVWTSNNVEQSNEIPTITRTTFENSTRFAINASSPAISLPISSHSGDAGDSFNITFGVEHNGEYSSFTAYNLNYTFSIDPRLDPEEYITICLFNASKDPFFCEDVPFINYTVVREGYHEV